MKSNAFIAVLFTTLVLLTSPVFVWSQTGVDQGVYLNGLGWYNYNTARATSINVDSVIKWKADLRKIQYARRDWQQVLANDKKLKADEIKQRIAQREQELRENPSAQDVMTGDALNVLQYDLTDPQISLSQWQSKQVNLPEGLSIKDLVFKFMPAGKTNQSAIALSRGVIALSRLDIKGKWPTSLNLVSLEKEKAAYESAYETVREQILGKDFHIGSVLAMDRSIDALRSKVNTEVPVERGYRTEALKFVDDLKDATRMFDAATVDYAREILIDTKEHDATTVGQLMGFMLKYRLQFANVERDPKARELYTKVYDAMRQQVKELGVKPGEPLVGDPISKAEDNKPITLISKDSIEGWALTKSLSTPNWIVKNGILSNNASGPHLVTVEKYNNFDLHLEFMLPPECNSGVYLRGRYEVQLLDNNVKTPWGKPVEDVQKNGSVYGLIAPKRFVYSGTNKWNALDVRLVDRVITMSINKIKVMENAKIEKVCAGALDDRELDPGPIMLQSHGSPGAYFRNITITPLP